MNKLPPVRSQDIVMQDLGQEILLYDLTINKAFCLNQTASIVFRHCDGITNLADLKFKNRQLSDEVIFLTLDLLQKNNLIESPNYQSPFADLSRREVIRKVGLASMIALPLISSVIAPSAAMSASLTTCAGILAPNADAGGQCNFGGDFPGSAEFCNQLVCDVTTVGNLCSSCKSHAVLDPAPGPNFYRCLCN